MLLALAGCCANDICVCDDKLADALCFRFQTGSDAASFQPSEVDTFYIVRITPAATATRTATTKDSVRQVLKLNDKGTALLRDTIVINNASPFASSGTTKLNAYTYQITAYQTDKSAAGGRRRYTFGIKNIQLAGDYSATGCCTCYSNTFKQFDVSQRANSSSTETKPVTAPAAMPIITLLKKQ